jgi:predicted ATPase
MGFYNLNADSMRALQRPEPGELLRRDGGNIAAVLARLSRERPEVKRRIEEYLAQVVPGVKGVDTRVLGPMETLEFRQQVADEPHGWRFPPGSMSDGTLRALGVLVALFQGVGDYVHGASLVGVEEPEVALHPAAAGVLRDALRDASTSTQVIVTSHSPDLLDDSDIPIESILAVVAEGGTTRIGRLDEADRSVLRDHLYTAGELLRLGQLAPDRQDRTPTARSTQLFDPVPA